MSRTGNVQTKANGNISDRRLEANRSNAQLSTGPISEAGKATSARNNFRHGFTGAFCLLPDENEEAFDQLCRDLAEEHRPGTTTETLLVNDMARHYWLYTRALRLQEDCFALDISEPSAQARLNLLLRYGTAHERSFHRCLFNLSKLRKERLALQRGFESQERARALEERRNKLAAREDEAYEKEKNKPLDEVESMLQYFREMNLRDLMEQEEEDQQPKRISRKKVA